MGFVITSGNAENAAERRAAENPMVVEILIFENFEKTELKFDIVEITIHPHRHFQL